MNGAFSSNCRSRAQKRQSNRDLRLLIGEFARDNVVYAGIVGVQLLPYSGCGLRVRTVGTFMRRVERVAEGEHLSHTAAERRVREHDREVRARTDAHWNRYRGVRTEMPSDRNLSGCGNAIDQAR